MKLIYLSEKFYAQYSIFPEILKKETRPYACLTVLIDGITFAIPFRHHINHSHAFITNGMQGLDYSKAVVIENEEYISPFPAWIETSDFNAIKGREARIVNGMRKYYRLYLKAMENRDNPHYANIVNYSTLKYFIK